MTVKAISTNIGKALLINALFMLISILVAVFNGMDSGFTPMVISFLVTAITGIFPFIFVKDKPSTTLHSGYLTIVFSWILSFMFGMLPYVLWGGEFTLMNAWFESVSGYTTTGSTILTDIEALPKSLLMWRSSTHYIGGLGVVVFLLLILPDTSTFKFKLSHLELSSIAKEGYRYKSGKTVRVITLTYIGLTVAEFLCLWAAGMTPFDAINHAFSTIATGGFSTKNMSVGAFGSDAINLVVLFFMAVCAMHFGLIYAVFATGSLKPLKNSVVRYYFGSIAVMSMIIMFSLMTKGGYESWGRALLDSSFTVVSYLSTAGFAICDNSTWPWLAGVVLLMASFQCGCAGSTTGGIKVDRIIIAFKAVSNEIRHRLHPSSVSHARLSGQHLADDAVNAVLMYIVVYFLVIFVSILAVILCGTEATEAVSGVIASVGSVGPGLSEIGCMDNYALQPSMAKFIYTFDMFLGRVEIYPVLIVISLIFKKRG